MNARCLIPAHPACNHKAHQNSRALSQTAGAFAMSRMGAAMILIDETSTRADLERWKLAIT